MSEIRQLETIVLEGLIDVYTSRAREILQGLTRLNAHLRCRRQRDKVDAMSELTRRNEALFNQLAENLKDSCKTETSSSS